MVDQRKTPGGCGRNGQVATHTVPTPVARAATAADRAQEVIQKLFTLSKYGWSIQAESTCTVSPYLGHNCTHLTVWRADEVEFHLANLSCRFSKRQRYAVPIRATGGQSLGLILIDQCGQRSRLPSVVAVVKAISPENLSSVDSERSSICTDRRRFPKRRRNAMSRLLSSDAQSARRRPHSVRTQLDSLDMFVISILPCGRPTRPLRRVYVDGVSSPNEMKMRAPYPSQTCVTARPTTGPHQFRYAKLRCYRHPQLPEVAIS